MDEVYDRVQRVGKVSVRLGKYEYWRSPNGRWYYHLRYRNGQIGPQGQGYRSRWNVRRAIRQLVRQEGEW